MSKLELSKSELNGKSVLEYLNTKYDSVEKMRGYSYQLDNKWVEVLTEEDIRMNEIIKKYSETSKTTFPKYKIFQKITINIFFPLFSNQKFTRINNTQLTFFLFW